MHFVSIMAADSKQAIPQVDIDWIENDRRRRASGPGSWIMPFLHVAPFSDGSNHPSNLDMRAQMGPVLERMGVPIVLTCHDRSYERTYPLKGVPDNIQAGRTPRRVTAAGRNGVAEGGPGRKMSNINGKFAQCKTTPAPSWTAFRDNTMHHFARLRIRRCDQGRGFRRKRRREPPVVQDTFRVRSSGCS